MNIHDYWPLHTEEKVSSVSEWTKLLWMRYETFQGFLAVEAHNGLIRPGTSLSTSQGQEMLRILAFRVIEELAEAIESEDKDHYLEELIDAFNYMLAFFMMSAHPRLEELAIILDSWQEAFRRVPAGRFQQKQLGYAARLLGANLGDLLRNRAWMQNAQNTYLDADLPELLKILFHLIFEQFRSFDEFYCYFVAKDSVLQFRLRSNY